MELLNEFEKRVIDKLLAGNHPDLVALRAQAGRLLVSRREYSGVGFFCDLGVPSEVQSLPVGRDFQIGDVNGNIDGLKHGVGFVLFVRNGRLAMLEGHTYEEPWPQDLRNLKLTYQEEPRKLRF